MFSCRRIFQSLRAPPLNQEEWEYENEVVGDLSEGYEVETFGFSRVWVGLLVEGIRWISHVRTAQMRIRCRLCVISDSV